jgi:hypothetical protein
MNRSLSHPAGGAGHHVSCVRLIPSVPYRDSHASCRDSHTCSIKSMHGQMPSPSSAHAPGAQKISTREIFMHRISAIARRGLLIHHGGKKSMLLLLLCMAAGELQGCNWPATPPAPSPTPNPHPQAIYHLKISVQDGSGVNNVEVKSLWTVGNIGCAPLNPISGAAMVKQVDVNEKVEKVGPKYIATIIKDRFLPDKCRWSSDGWEIRFMHNDYILSTDGSGLNEFDTSEKLELTCIPPPDTPPLCGLRSSESFDRSHFSGVFNATLEMVK